MQLSLDALKTTLKSDKIVSLGHLFSKIVLRRNSLNFYTEWNNKCVMCANAHKGILSSLHFQLKYFQSPKDKSRNYITDDHGQ